MHDQLFALLKSSKRLYDSLVLAKDHAACHLKTVPSAYRLLKGIRPLASRKKERRDERRSGWA